MSSVLKEVAKQTGTKPSDWVAINGPDSGCGVDFWFAHKLTGRQVYANMDQGEISVEVLDAD
jgi:hypothetical protein